MHVLRQQLGDLMDVLEGGADIAEHVLAGGQGLDLTDFAVIAGSRFEPGSKVLSATCDRVCGRLGQLLVAVGGAVRVLRTGFAGSIRGGAATFDRLSAACDAYGAAKRKVRDADAMFQKTSGQQREHYREQRVEAEVSVALAQKRIIEALGGSLITASTQASAAQQQAKPKPTGGSNSAPPQHRPAAARPRPTQKRESSNKKWLLAALAAGTVFAITR